VTPFNLKVGSYINFDVEMKMEKSPSLLWAGVQVVVMVLVGDPFYSLGHWLLHNTSLYRFHKVHH
jgi:sterol desaturase/sphingolipid hydroxylase (fatty acid hydroxylase superfamily)